MPLVSDPPNVAADAAAEAASASAAAGAVGHEAGVSVERAVEGVFEGPADSGFPKEGADAEAEGAAEDTAGNRHRAMLMPHCNITISSACDPACQMMTTLEAKHQTQPVANVHKAKQQEGMHLMPW